MTLQNDGFRSALPILRTHKTPKIRPNLKRGPMTLLVKDANTTVQSLATEVDGSGHLVPLHAPAVTNAQGVATAAGPQNPLPVINTAASVAGDGSSTVATGGSAQTLFGVIVPANGFLVQN